uniref:Uncharacterized protein n=1 Tax=Sipha flava TaxID=143950 RepID=A0A2S2QIH2_9HEMI
MQVSVVRPLARCANISTSRAIVFFHVPSLPYRRADKLCSFTRLVPRFYGSSFPCRSAYCPRVHSLRAECRPRAVVAVSSRCAAASCNPTQFVRATFSSCRIRSAQPLFADQHAGFSQATSQSCSGDSGSTSTAVKLAILDRVTICYQVIILVLSILLFYDLYVISIDYYSY